MVILTHAFIFSLLTALKTLIDDMTTIHKNKWVAATKKQAAVSGNSYKKTLTDKDHRITYHHNQCDPVKMFRGGTLLPYNHPAATPVPDFFSHATPTAAVKKAQNAAMNKHKDNTINYLKNLRKK